MCGEENVRNAGVRVVHPGDKVGFVAGAVVDARSVADGVDEIRRHLGWAATKKKKQKGKHRAAGHVTPGEAADTQGWVTRPPPRVDPRWAITY